MRTIFLYHLTAVLFFGCSNEVKLLCKNSFNIFALHPGSSQKEIEAYLLSVNIEPGGDDYTSSSDRYFHWDTIADGDTLNYTYYLKFEAGTLASVHIDLRAKDSLALQNIVDATIFNCYPGSIPHDDDILLYEKIDDIKHSMTAVIPQQDGTYLALYTIASE